MAKTREAEIIHIGGQKPTAGANEAISYSEPYTVEVTITGTSDLIFHRWNADAVDEKAAARKGSKAKKTDDVESYVYRDEKGNISLPGEYLRQAIIHAAKYRQDPRSPRKSAMDLFKAGVISLTPLADLGKEKWDYEDRRRVVIQRNAINRVRPAMKVGWVATIQFQINLPEYIEPALLHEVIEMAGKLIGVGDFRPTYGRFRVTAFNIL